MKSRRAASGMTLPEIIIGIAILTLLSGAGYSVLHLAGRSRSVTETAEGWQTAMLIQEQIETDLRNLAPSGSNTADVAWGDKPARLCLWVWDWSRCRGDPNPLTLFKRGIIYRLDAADTPLQRMADPDPHKAQSVGHSTLSSVSFSPFEAITGPLIRVTVTLSKDKANPQAEPVVYSFLSCIPVHKIPPVLELVHAINFEDFGDQAAVPAFRELPSR